jgi:hypothetical protein
MTNKILEASRPTPVGNLTRANRFLRHPPDVGNLRVNIPAPGMFGRKNITGSYWRLFAILPKGLTAGG